MATITGTSGSDTLTGGTGNDVLRGLGGDDILRGKGGDNNLWGGDGDDQLYGGAGGDEQFFGEGGRDYFNVVREGSGPGKDFLLDAGTGPSLIHFLSLNRYLDRVTIIGGDEPGLRDVMTIEGGQTVTIDAGAGDDQILLYDVGGQVHVTLGAGADVLSVDSDYPRPPSGLLTIYDFEPGPGGDTLDLRSMGFSKRLVQQGANAVFQIDPDGGGPGGFRDFIVLVNTQAANIKVHIGGVYYHKVSTVRATDGADVLTGDTQSNALSGRAGADVIYGRAGDDVIDGGAGVDRMQGGAGDDLYIVDNAADRIIEYARQGIDTARSLATYTLPDHVENLVLAGGKTIDGYGNSLANTITGNDAANVLDGAAGADTLIGGNGHDTYIVDDVSDVVVEGGSGGTDSVYSSVDYRLPIHVEKLFLAGTAGRDGRANSMDNVLVGNSGGNLLNGGSGNDRVDGGAGNDLLYGHTGKDDLTGGAGADRFLFNTALEPSNVDRIRDFSAVDDRIDLASYIFTRAGPKGALNASAFHQGPGAADASDRIIYDQASGSLFYDPDGTGAAAQTLFAVVDAGTLLTSADFYVYG